MPPAEAPPRPDRPAAASRRTVVIRGQVAPRAGGTASAGPARRRPPRRPSERIVGTRRIADGSEIALETARLRCRLRDGRLTVAIEAQITAGDTAPPDIEALT